MTAMLLCFVVTAFNSYRIGIDQGKKIQEQLDRKKLIDPGQWREITMSECTTDSVAAHWPPRNRADSVYFQFKAFDIISLWNEGASPNATSVFKYFLLKAVGKIGFFEVSCSYHYKDFFVDAYIPCADYYLLPR